MSDQVSLKDGEPFTSHVPVRFRWEKYSPRSNEFRGGKLGRWQECNDYGWRNTKWSEEQIIEGFEI